MKKNLTRCGNTWTEAKYIAFIKAQLRRATWKWPIFSQVKNAAKRGRNQYECNHCHNVFPNKEIQLDHITPIVSPDTGFTGWNDFVNGLFCEADNLQVLCKECHSKKSLAEKAIATKSRKNKNE